MKIVFIVNCSFSAWWFRKGLLKNLVQAGHEVLLVAPQDVKYNDLIRAFGVRHISIRMSRFFSPASDLVYIYNLYRILRREKPDVVHNYTIKPNIYGTWASRLAGIKRIFCSVTGLGYMFSDDVEQSFYYVRKLAAFMYKLAFKMCDAVTFQNDDDMRLFIEKGIVDKKKSVLIRSSGIDLEEFMPGSVSVDLLQSIRNEFQIAYNVRIIMMMARAIWSKGVREFIEASKQVSKITNNVLFVLVGGIENGPESVSVEYLIENQGKHFRWLGYQTRVKYLFELAEVVVLPSYYREGVPRCLLEAMAIGKPIVTTDNVGCREVVEDGVNGYCVPVKNSKALAEAIQKLLDDKEKRKEYGIRSRLKVEEEFSEQMVVKQTMSALYK